MAKIRDSEGYNEKTVVIDTGQFRDLNELACDIWQQRLHKYSTEIALTGQAEVKLTQLKLAYEAASQHKKEKLLEVLSRSMFFRKEDIAPPTLVKGKWYRYPDLYGGSFCFRFNGNINTRQMGFTSLGFWSDDLKIRESEVKMYIPIEPQKIKVTFN